MPLEEPISSSRFFSFGREGARGLKKRASKILPPGKENSLEERTPELEKTSLWLAKLWLVALFFSLLFSVSQVFYLELLYSGCNAEVEVAKLDDNKNQSHQPHL